MHPTGMHSCFIFFFDTSVHDTIPTCGYLGTFTGNWKSRKRERKFCNEHNDFPHTDRGKIWYKLL